MTKEEIISVVEELNEKMYNNEHIYKSGYGFVSVFHNYASYVQFGHEVIWNSEDKGLYSKEELAYYLLDKIRVMSEDLRTIYKLIK